MQRFTYPVKLRPEPTGGFAVTFPDIPEAITQGDSFDEALENAADALEEAIAGRIRLKEELPQASKSLKGALLVSLPPQMASKAAHYVASRSSWRSGG